MSKVIDLTGKTFGRLYVKEDVVRAGKNIYICDCTCGNTKETLPLYLRNGNVSSCGCLEIENRKLQWQKRTKHGMGSKLNRNRLYNIWCKMKARCADKNHLNYQHYGGRGILVCNEWKNSFESFRDWTMENGYTKELTIDRIDNNGNYEPGNCRWATKTEQHYNKRNTAYYQYKGKNYTMLDILKEFPHMSRSVIYGRITAGWTIEESIEIPLHSKRVSKK